MKVNDSLSIYPTLTLEEFSWPPLFVGYEHMVDADRETRINEITGCVKIMADAKLPPSEGSRTPCGTDPDIRRRARSF